MIFLTGDTHRHFERVEKFCARFGTTRDDVLIILGDAGINYYGKPKDSVFKMYLNELPITLMCIHGNHEMRPESIKTYRETERFGGRFYWEPRFENLLFAKDGEIYEMEGRRCVVIGGAYSVDKEMRVQGVSWWPDEQPSDEIKKRIECRLGAEHWSVDVVLSHTCPHKYMPREAFLKGIEENDVDNSTELWLDSIEDRLSYSSWLCGHFHTNKIIDNMVFLYDEVRRLKPIFGI